MSFIFSNLCLCNPKCNIHRIIITSFCKNVQIADPITIEVGRNDPKTSEEYVVEAAIFLPRVMFSNLGSYDHELFASLFSLNALDSFWTRAQATNDERFFQHPIVHFEN
jgi:hypothetical protein